MKFSVPLCLRGGLWFFAVFGCGPKRDTAAWGEFATDRQPGRREQAGGVAEGGQMQIQFGRGGENSLGSGRDPGSGWRQRRPGDDIQLRFNQRPATGILLEMTISHNFVATSDETDSEHWKITQFNSAETPSDGTDGTDGTGSSSTLPDWVFYAVIIAVVVVVAALVAVLMLRRRKKTDVEEPAPSPVEPQPPV